MHYILRSLCVAVKGPKGLCGDNQGMIISSANPDYELKKNHVDKSYHKLQYSDASGIANTIKFCTTVKNPTYLLCQHL